MWNGDGDAVCGQWRWRWAAANQSHPSREIDNAQYRLQALCTNCTLADTHTERETETERATETESKTKRETAKRERATDKEREKERQAERGRERENGIWCPCERNTTLKMAKPCSNHKHTCAHTHTRTRTVGQEHNHHTVEIWKNNKLIKKLFPFESQIIRASVHPASLTRQYCCGCYSLGDKAAPMFGGCEQSLPVIHCFLFPNHRAFSIQRRRTQPCCHWLEKDSYQKQSLMWGCMYIFSKSRSDKSFW